MEKTAGKACQRSGVKVTSQMLRVWFCNKMGELGFQDRYIGIFCGRAPKSVLAKHYTSREIQKLKAIYGKADLKVRSLKGVEFHFFISCEEYEDIGRKLDKSDELTHELLGHGWNGKRPFWKLHDFL